MPKVATEITDNYESITRPVALCVIRQVAEILNLPSTISILYPGASEEAAMTGSTLNYKGDNSTFKYTGKFHVEITETAVEDRVLSTAVHRKENLPAFLDKDLGVRITPIYSGTEMIFTCVYRASNRVLAKRFRDDALMKTAMMRKENLHELTYHYSFPHTYLRLLSEIHRMREAVAPYGDTFDKWVSEHLTLRATNLTTLIGTEMQLAVGENQICPLGWFDFNAEPEEETKDREGGTWNVRFEYRLTYDKVIGAAAEWPLVVHNQLVDEAYRDTPNASGVQVNPDRRRRAPTVSRNAFDYFTNSYTSECKRKFDGIVIPEYDEFEPATVHPDTSSIAMIMLTVDLDDRTLIVDLNELGDYEIDSDIRTYLRTEAVNMTRFGECPIYVSLYRGDVPLDDGSISIDANLVVRSTNPLNPRERYHLRISIVNDLTLLPNSVIDRWRMFGVACIKMLSTLQWKLLGDAFVPNLLGGTIVSRYDINWLGQRINDLKAAHHTGIEYRMLTVGNFIVVTHRSNDYADHETLADGSDNNGPGTGIGDGSPVSRCDS